MKRFWIGAAAVVAAWASPASAIWLEASTSHFVITGDMTEAQAGYFASRLERYDQGLRKLFLNGAQEDPSRRANRLHIYVVANGSEVRQLCGANCANVLGVYYPRAGGSVAFTPLVSGNGSAMELGAGTVLFHEYAHHFMYQNFTAAYPAWYSEGFAEFNSTARFESETMIGFGLPASHRAWDLFEGKQVPVTQVIEAAGHIGDPNLAEIVYARGWLLTHYLILNPARHGQLATYIAAINKGVPNLDAAKQAFGDLDKLNVEIDRYKNSNRMSYGKIPLDPLGPSAISIRRLGPGEAAMMPVHMRSTRGVDHDGALALVPVARRSAAPFPNDPVVQIELAEAEFDAGYDKEAEAAADRALAADPRNMTAMLYKGRVAIRRAQAAHSTDPAVWKAARGWFSRANRLDPNAAEPLVAFYDSFVEETGSATPNATLGLARAFQLAPEDPGVRMRFALQSIRDKQAANARAALAPIAYDPHGGGMRDQAARIMALIDKGKLDDAGALAEISAKTDDDPK